MMATCRLASSGPSTVGHNWTIFHSTAGPALAVRDGAVMYASTGPAPGRRGMLTGKLCIDQRDFNYFAFQSDKLYPRDGGYSGSCSHAGWLGLGSGRSPQGRG